LPVLFRRFTPRQVGILSIGLLLTGDLGATGPALFTY
jgi:hypothetical protein